MFVTHYILSYLKSKIRPCVCDKEVVNCQKQRSVIITLLDLKNAFNELHHSLIYEVLQYHHLPRKISDLIQSLYTNFQTSIITEQFSTPFIAIGRGVLQGDCLSPLLFKMSFRTFIQSSSEICLSMRQISLRERVEIA